MIRSRTVRAPDGTAWTIRRRWAPRPRWRGRRRERTRDPNAERRGRWLDWLPDIPNIDFGDELAAGLLIVLGLVIFVVFMIFIGWPLLLFLLETLLIIPVTFVIGVIGRVLFRRPWTLEASGGPGRRVEWNVVGWRASSQAAERMGWIIAAGNTLPAEAPVLTPRAHRRRVR